MVIPQEIREELGPLLIFQLEWIKEGMAYIRLQKAEISNDDLRISKNVWGRKSKLN